MTVTLVPVHEVDTIWLTVAPGFANCLRKTPGPNTVADYWTMCREGSAFLIICHDNAIHAASVWRFEGDKFCCLIMYGADADRWTHDLFECAATLARANGCKALIASGRLGLGQMLKRNNVNIKTIRQTYLVEV